MIKLKKKKIGNCILIELTEETYSILKQFYNSKNWFPNFEEQVQLGRPLIIHKDYLLELNCLIKEYNNKEFNNKFKDLIND